MIKEFSCMVSPSSSKRHGNNEVLSTVGYPRVEKLVETENFDALNQNFGNAHQELSKIAKQKAGLVKGKLAIKAMKAIDLTMDLLKELLKLKYKLVEVAENTQENK